MLISEACVSSTGSEIICLWFCSPVHGAEVPGLLQECVPSASDTCWALGHPAPPPPGTLLEHSNWRSGGWRAGTHISGSIIKFIWRAEFICPEGWCLAQADRGPYV